MDNKNLSSEALLSNNGDMTFLDIVLPIHNFTYIQAYRAKSVKLISSCIISTSSRFQQIASL